MKEVTGKLPASRPRPLLWVELLAEQSLPLWTQRSSQVYSRLLRLAPKGGSVGSSELGDKHVRLPLTHFSEPNLEKVVHDDFHRVRTASSLKSFMNTVGKYNCWYYILV